MNIEIYTAERTRIAEMLATAAMSNCISADDLCAMLVQPEEKVLAVLGAKLMARAPAAYRHVHDVADRYEVRLRRALKRTFVSAKREVNKEALQRALEIHDESGVYAAMNDGIVALGQKLQKVLEDYLSDTLESSGKVAADRLPSRTRAAAEKKEIEFKFDVTNPKAVEWIQRHAAETVTGITKATRDELRDLIEAAFMEQFDIDDLTREIADVIGDDSRAETIARTEVMRASNEGQQQAWDQAVETGFLTGTERKEWIVTPDDRLCPICEPLDGKTVALDDTFDVEGEDLDGPPAHPNCRCTLGLSV